MDKLHAMETFVRVIEAGSFKKAADILQVLPSTVTRTIKELESHLGVKLLHRTTRALSVSDAGLRYYDHCRAILAEVTAGESMVAQKDGPLHGVIKVGTTASLARDFLIPALPDFHERYPEISVDLQLDDAVVDMVQRGLDCVIRTGEPPSSRLIARRIGEFRWYVCASPDYLRRHGEPTTLDALDQHVAVRYAYSSGGHSNRWVFRGESGTVALPMSGYVSVDDTEAYVAAGIAGPGLIRVASYMVQRHIADGRLVRLLADVEAPPEPVSLLYPHSRHLAPATRAFIDWAVRVMSASAADW